MMMMMMMIIVNNICRSQILTKNNYDYELERSAKEVLNLVCGGLVKDQALFAPLLDLIFPIKVLKFQSPGRSDLSRDDSNMGDDSSSIGAKEEDEDDDNDEDLEDNSGDPERLKAFNVRLLKVDQS